MLYTEVEASGAETYRASSTALVFVPRSLRKLWYRWRYISSLYQLRVAEQHS